MKKVISCFTLSLQLWSLRIASDFGVDVKQGPSAPFSLTVGNALCIFRPFAASFESSQSDLSGALPGSPALGQAFLAGMGLMSAMVTGKGLVTG